MHRGLVAGLAVAVMLAGASSALAGGPAMRLGAAEDAAKWGDPVAKMNLARLAGFDTVRMTLQWSTGQTMPDAGELANTRAAADAARLAGIEPVIAVYNRGSSSTPADEASRAQFVQFATAVVQGLPSVDRFVIGNEPNSNVFWMPQFNLDGSDAAAPAYMALLAASYDAIKQARPAAVVLGGALAPRGADNPTGIKPTHSPTTFIRDLGAAYRASGRTTQLMDVFDMHVYADNSSLPPSMEHVSSRTIALADYGKLVSLLGEAFDGTAQAGSTLPILYGEFGVESIIPPAKATIYSGTEPETTRPVDEATQAQYYVEAFKVAYCQPNVIGILVFHVTDESALSRWQSGPYYADDTPKSSLPAIRDAANASRAGSLTSCPDATPPTATLTAPADGTLVGPEGVTLSAVAGDDVGVGRVQFLADGVVVETKYGPPYERVWNPTVSGVYTVVAQAQDAGHNLGTSASITITVDVTPPETTLTATPPDGQGSSEPAEFAFEASEPGAVFACSLAGAAFAACSSPEVYGGLAAGAHTFEVRASDALGNTDPTPAAYTWTVVDTTPPETTITGGPSGTTTAHDATFALAANESATFECALDGAAWSPCTSPIAYTALADGTHSFQVRATDAAGNIDPTPASRSWTVVTAPANDAFAAAAAISGSSGRTTGTTVNATREPGEPAHAGNGGGHSVWYRWTAPCNCWFTFETTGSSFNTLLAVYRGSTVSALTWVASNDDAASGTTTSRLRFKGFTGTTYQIAVDGKNAASGSVTLAWRQS